MQGSSQLNENVIRLNAFFTILVTISIIYFSSHWLALFLMLDFIIRGFTKFPSLLSIISKFLNNLFNLQFIPVFAPPKRFAAKVGFVITGLLFLSTLVQWDFLSSIIAGILLFCAFLEAFLKLCVGCYVYNWFVIPVFYDKLKRKK